jgi:hypothetical protein
MLNAEPSKGLRSETDDPGQLLISYFLALRHEQTFRHGTRALAFPANHLETSRDSAFSDFAEKKLNGYIVSHLSSVDADEECVKSLKIADQNSIVTALSPE